MLPIRYTVRFPAPQSHYASVEARIPTEGELKVDVFLPVWTPGSYLVREYARHVESLTASDGEGKPLKVNKIRKNRWRSASHYPIDEVVLRYDLYCHELSVRTNWVDGDYALLVGAATFLTVLNGQARQYEVTLELPPAWQFSWSGLPGGHNTFIAPDYDALVDCPIVAGSPEVRQFEVDEKRHVIVNVGDVRFWDLTGATQDVEKIVRQHRSLWGQLPYDNYLFLNLLTGGGGGLEHRNSVVMMADPLAPRTRDSYVAWLDLVSHEHFHAWNVKRLRPMELGPFDYENEVYTRNLWIVEGFTEYYGLLGVRRAGLTTNDEFLGSQQAPGATRKGGSLTGLITKLQSTPGRLQQSMSLASFDAWIKLYRPDENSVNSSISYYVKGAVIAWLLDAKIRAATQDLQSLDDVMRRAGLLFSGDKGFTTEGFYSIIQDVASVNLNEWLNQVIETTCELDYGEALGWFGLRFKPAAPSGSCEAKPKAFPGFSTKNDAGRLMVTQVLRNACAWDAGISSGDEILGMDGYRVRPEQWEQRLEQYRPGDDVILTISRHDRLASVSLCLGQESTEGWVVEVHPEANDSQKQHFTNWLTQTAASR